MGSKLSTQVNNSSDVDFSSENPPKTHANFQTVDPNVPDAKTMDKYLGGALLYQFMFDKRTTPWENDMWDKEELDSFKIDLEKVDRLYYIEHNKRSEGQDFTLVARMEQGTKHIYVEMTASCDYTGFECQGGGVIFVSTNANLFMKIVLMNEYDNNDLIIQSLKNDGIEVQEHTEFDLYSRMFWTQVPMLKYLCHLAIYDNKYRLQTHLPMLPKLLQDSLEDFIKFQDAKIVYYNFESW